MPSWRRPEFYADPIVPTQRSASIAVSAIRLRVGAVFAAAGILIAGCHSGDLGTNGESRDEARAQAATCASLLERHSTEPVAPIDPRLFEAAMRDPRLSDRSTTAVFLGVCGLIAKRRGLELPG